MSGTAVSGTDYTALSGNMTIPSASAVCLIDAGADHFMPPSPCTQETAKNTVDLSIIHEKT
jgi:hypothetical protein